MSTDATLPPLPDTKEPIQNTGAQKLHSEAPVQTTTNTVPHATTDAPGPGPASESYTSAGAETGHSILNTAQEQLGALAQSAAQYLPQSVKETVAPYLPAGTSVTAQASEHDTTHATSYPSTELTGAGAHEHVGGVGALPGRINERGVADAERVDHKHEHLTHPTPLTERVKQTVSPYLPAALVGASAGGVTRASEHDIPHQTSLPSTELTGAGPHEHVGGAGALPGSINQSRVALVPDERNESTSATLAGSLASARDATQGRAAQATTGLSGLAGAAGLAGTAGAAGFTGTKPPADVSLPSTETEGVRSHEHVSGAGALPGRAGEQGVALLPDERNKTAVGPKAESMPSRGAQQEKATKPAGAAARDAQGTQAVGAGYGGDYHPAALHPADADYAGVKTEGEPAGGAGQESHPAGTQARRTELDTSRLAPEADLAARSAEQSAAGTGPGKSETAPESPTAGSPQKSRFMDKVKGEFKILAGKISHKEQKVEEGRALKTGTAATQTEAQASSTTAQ